MGLSNSVETVKTLHDDLLSHVGQINHIGNAALCSYDEFMIQIQELNNLANKVVSQSNRRLAIGVKRGSADKIVLWRATVRIAVVQWDTNTNTVVSKRLLTLPQFLQVSTAIKQQLSAASSSTEGSLRRDLTFSRIFNEVDDASCMASLTECCICLERRPDVMLPCAHAYCLPCIEQWNTNHKTCPICRETVETTEDAWVLTDGPGSDDVRDEIYYNLIQLATEPNPNHR